MLVFGGKPEANFSKADVSTLVSNPNFLKFRSPFEKIIRRPAACAISGATRSRFYARLDEKTIINLKNKRSQWKLYIRLFDSEHISHITFEQARCTCLVNGKNIFAPTEDQGEAKKSEKRLWPDGLNLDTFKQHKSLDLTGFAPSHSAKSSNDKKGMMNIEIRSHNDWRGIAVIEVIFLRTSDDLFKRFLGYYYRNFSLIRKCEVCQREEQLRRCSRCKSVWYCSAEHQTAAWANHQFHCEEFIPPPELQTLGQICQDRHTSTEDNGTGLENFLVTTICPLTKNQIETPVRGEYCNHIQCVDLKGYLTIQEELTNFACPICTKPMRLENINLDTFMQEILRDIGEEVDVVRIFSDGSYKQEKDEEAPLNPIKLSPRKPDIKETKHVKAIGSPKFRSSSSSELSTQIPSLGEETTTQTWKTIVFIRHGNSTWNQAMKFSQPLRAVGAMSRGLNEYMKLKFSKDGYDHKSSIIVDAPLSTKGITEAVDLAKFLQLNIERQNQKHMALLNRQNELTQSFRDALYELEAEIKKPPEDCKTAAESQGVAKAVELLQKGILEMSKELSAFPDQVNMNWVWNKSLSKSYNDFPMDIPEILEMLYTPTKNSVMVASNLRRAVSTAVIAFWKRFTSRGSQEKLYILSCLQEFGGAADTQTELKEYQTPQASQHEIQCGLLDPERLNEFYQRRLDGTHNYGNKTNNSRDDPAPCRAFCKWCFSQPKSVIIATGHSLWFKLFCRYLNPGDPSNVLAKHKLKNCSVVGFRIAQITSGSGEVSYRIAPRSITMAYGGFES